MMQEANQKPSSFLKTHVTSWFTLLLSVLLLACCDCLV
uniref:Uncharacterized protein n=1 Tax=Anguilla anguilla TaxID=7936 RepID=A0A0E9XD33_ANGAN